MIRARGSKRVFSNQIMGCGDAIGEAVGSRGTMVSGAPVVPMGCAGPMSGHDLAGCGGRPHLVRAYEEGRGPKRAFPGRRACRPPYVIGWVAARLGLQRFRSGAVLSPRSVTTGCAAQNRCRDKFKATKRSFNVFYWIRAGGQLRWGPPGGGGRQGPVSDGVADRAGSEGGGESELGVGQRSVPQPPCDAAGPVLEVPYGPGPVITPSSGTAT